MKTVAKETSAGPSQIFSQEVRHATHETRAKLPLEDSVKRTLRNQRNPNAPVNPQSLEDLVIGGNS